MGDDLPDEIVADPFFAEVLGTVIVRCRASPLLLDAHIG